MAFDYGHYEQWFEHACQQEREAEQKELIRQVHALLPVEEPTGDEILEVFRGLRGVLKPHVLYAPRILKDATIFVRLNSLFNLLGFGVGRKKRGVLPSVEHVVADILYGRARDRKVAHEAISRARRAKQVENEQYYLSTFPATSS